jgi:hypothetical protein
LRIIQKMVPGTVYQNADLQNKSFVWHTLSVGPGSGWRYGAGTTDASGLITITSVTSSSGPQTQEGSPGIFSVNGSGVVTNSVTASFGGFLSDDKKTIVATESSSDGTNSRLTIIQITGQTYTAGPMSAGVYTNHWLVGGAAPAPFWAHFTFTTDSNGVGTMSNVVSSNPGFAAGVSPVSVSSSGTVTLAQSPSYHGQVSHDGKFIVGTRTFGSSGAYALNVSTK